jgi:predicted DNA-binding protein
MSDMIDGVPNKPKTKGRSIRVPDELWQEALNTSHQQGETISDVVREALQEYVEKHRKGNGRRRR